MAEEYRFPKETKFSFDGGLRSYWIRYEGEEWQMWGAPHEVFHIPSWSGVALDVKRDNHLTEEFFHDLIWYLGRCNIAGLMKNDDAVRACAERYIAGKRKVTAPGTQRRKDAEKKRRELLNNLPAELLAALDVVCESEPAKQFAAGNDKALNSLTGMVMKQYKTDAALVKDLLTKRLRP
jgi:hypothetical protein